MICTKNNLGGQILYRSPGPPKNGIFTVCKNIGQLLRCVRLPDALPVRKNTYIKYAWSLIFYPINSSI